MNKNLVKIISSTIILLFVHTNTMACHMEPATPTSVLAIATASATATTPTSAVEIKFPETNTVETSSTTTGPAITEVDGWQTTSSQAINTTTAPAINTSPNHGTIIKPPAPPKASTTTPQKYTIPVIKPVKSIVNTTHSTYLYKDMVSEISYLVKYYGKAMKVDYIGKTVLGKPIPRIILGNPVAKNRLLITGATHAREYITAQLVLRQVEYYLQNYNKTLNGITLDQFFATTSFEVIPMLNPDGVDICQLGQKAVPSSFLPWFKKIKLYEGSYNKWKTNANGVDLNRNFDVNWLIQKTKSTTFSSYDFKGKSVASEPETLALQKLICKEGYFGFLDYHTMGEVIYWDNRRKKTDPLYARDLALAKKLQKLTHYKLIPPIPDPTAISRCYFIKMTQNPAFTIEVGKSTSPVKISEFSKIWADNRYVPLKMAVEIETALKITDKK